MKLISKIATFGVSCACAFALAGCASMGGEGESASDSAVASYADIENMDLEYTDRDKRDTYDEASATKILLAGDSISCEGDGVSIEGGTATIESEGTYVVSGELTDGQLKVNIGDTEKAQIVLAGATIHNETSAAIYVEQADKCFITLADGTENTLSDSANYSFAEGEDEPNAALFSKDDLTINGNGTLNVTGNYKHGIYSKDDLVITGGTFVVSAVSDGVRGKDSLKILEGIFAIEAGQDCLKASRDDDPARGFVVINGGDFSLHAGDDAIHGETYVLVTDGVIDIPTCVEGLEAMVVQVDGGDIDVVAQDDAINAAAPSASSDAQGDAELAPGKDTEQRPGDLDDDRGEMGGKRDPDPSAQVEEGGALQDPGERRGERAEQPGLDRAQDDPSGGRMDDRGGFDDLPDIPDGMDGQERGFGGKMNEGNESCQIIINGGTITLEAKGDAIDSNGSVQVNGGTIYATGPTSNGDSALDYELEAVCNGGTILMVGPSGMAQSFSEGTQPFAFAQVRGEAGQVVSVKDQAGTTLISYTPSADFETLIISSPDFIDNQTYTLVVGETQTKITPATSQVGQKA